MSFATNLPSYSPGRAPSYSADPSDDEQRIAHSLAMRRRPGTGIYVHSNDAITLTLTGQDVNVTIPTYGYGAHIRGDLRLSVTDLPDVVAVDVKLEGVVQTQIDENQIHSRVFLSEDLAMWRLNLTTRQPCPSILPLDIRIPQTYQFGRQQRHLPPSYSIMPLDVQKKSSLAACSYRLLFQVEKTRKLRYIRRTKSMIIKLRYYPRQHPLSPILPAEHTLLSSIKSAPEEWHQITTILGPLPGLQVDPIFCALYIPSSQVYAFSDTISVHVQIQASTSSEHVGGMTARVYLKRVALGIAFERRMLREMVIGEGSLTTLPSDTTRRGCQDWEGHIRCNPEIDVGGFTTDTLTVKDYIVLVVSSSQRSSFPFIKTQVQHPIVLVTDTRDFHPVHQ